MPLMKRTVREDSGAWSLLKNAVVRAKVTATSGASGVVSGLRYTPRIVPLRSTTATARVLSLSAPAAAVMTAVTSSAVRVWATPPMLCVRTGSPGVSQTASSMVSPASRRRIARDARRGRREKRRSTLWLRMSGVSAAPGRPGDDTGRQP